MASAEAQSSSSFPPPPIQYITKYTDDNVKFGRAPKPPPPIKDSYLMFGVEFRADDQIIRPLESQSLLRLHPHNYDHKRELKKLNYSILVNFLDLLDVLVKAPESRRRLEKIDDLTLLFIHMHHLINEFRPHQARETLRVMLENQKQQRLEITERFEKRTEQVKDLLNATIAALPDDTQLDTKLLINKTHPSLLPLHLRSGHDRYLTTTTTNNINQFNDNADIMIKSGYLDSDDDDDDGGGIRTPNDTNNNNNNNTNIGRSVKKPRKLKKKPKKRLIKKEEYSRGEDVGKDFYDDLGTVADDDENDDDDDDNNYDDDDDGDGDNGGGGCGAVDDEVKDGMMCKIVDALN